jgi:hypothetical protein
VARPVSPAQSTERLVTSTPYDNQSYAAGGDVAPQARSLGEHIFIWVAWALAAAFWGASLTAMGGILQALATPTPGGGDFAGVARLLAEAAAGVVLLGAAMAYGSRIYARRNRPLDSARDVATAALYDPIERQGGAEWTGRARAERDLY